MSTNHIKLEPVLDASQSAELDAFCAAHRGTASLPSLAAFLRSRFAVDLELDPDIVVGFTTDSSLLPGAAQGVGRPSSVKACAVMLRACAMAGIPVTVSGGKSNLTGSATPEGGVVVSTVNLRGGPAPTPPIRLDAARRTVECPVGLILEELREAVRTQSARALIFPVDPTSRADATVGGALACNASGFVPGPAGATREWVAALDFLLPNGLMVRAARGEYVSRDGVFGLDDGRRVTALPVPRYVRPAIKNAGGPYSAPDGVMDFVDLVVGSEGLFGMVTGCTLKLAPCPTNVFEIFFSLPEERAALAFYHHVRRRLSGNLGVLSALEYFGAHCPQYMDHRDLLFRPGHQVGLYLAVPLHTQSIEDAAEEWMATLLEADCGIREEAVMLLDNDRSRTLFFEARHSLPANALEVVKARGTFTIMTDTAVPPERFQEFLEYAHGTLRAAGLDYLAFGHLGDCHLHFTLLPHAAQVDAAVALYDGIVAKSAELGGVYSGEHGTGKRKRKDFLRCYGPAAVEEIRRCKAAVDPEFLFNRGNVVEA